MTLDEFTKYLKEIASLTSWYVEPSGELRTRIKNSDGLSLDHCPISAVITYMDADIDAWDMNCWEDSAKQLGLQYETARKIVDSADYTEAETTKNKDMAALDDGGRYFDRELRQKMLAIVRPEFLS